MTKPPNFYFSMLLLSAGKWGSLRWGPHFRSPPLSFALTATPGETRLPPNWFHPSIPSDLSQPVELIRAVAEKQNTTLPEKNKKTKNPPLTAHLGSRTLTAHHPTILNSRTQACTRYTHYTLHMQAHANILSSICACECAHRPVVVSGLGLGQPNPPPPIPQHLCTTQHSIPTSELLPDRVCVEGSIGAYRGL